jgi:ATP-binding cassette subfamily B (MDR/TAP) protein 1
MFRLAAILRSEASWFDKHNSAVLTARLSADAPLVRAVLVDKLVTLVQNLGLVATAFAITITLQWKIALVMISTFPAMILSYAGQVGWKAAMISRLTSPRDSECHS